MFSSKATKLTIGAVLAILLAALLFVGRGYAAGDMGTTLKPLYTLLGQTEAAVQAGNFAAATTDVNQLDSTWDTISNQVKAVSTAQYQDVETRLGEAKAAISGAKASDAMTALGAMDTDFDTVVKLAASGTTAAPTSSVPLSTVLSELSDAQAAISRLDAPTALTTLDKARNDWFGAEDQVKGRSVDAYHQFEQDLPLALAALKQSPPDFATAGRLVSGLSATLTPIVALVSSPYTAFDAGIVLLREGFEAILIITALVAFVVKSGNADKRAWIWVGGGVGIAASLLAALALQLILGAATTGANGRLIEGIVGLIAAVMLFYVSYWLHSKSSAAAWTQYIKRKSSAALAGGSLLSLAILAFLSVFREGAETAMFYLGMAGSISTGDLLLGLAGGLAALGLLAVLMIKIGVRIPIHTFFLISSALIYYLGFKFVGTSILALQGVNVLPAHAISWLPSLDFFGFYPTIEGVAVQGALLIAGAIVWLYSRRHHAVLAQQAKVQPQG